MLTLTTAASLSSVRAFPMQNNKEKYQYKEGEWVMTKIMETTVTIYLTEAAAQSYKKTKNSYKSRDPTSTERKIEKAC